MSRSKGHNIIALLAEREGWLSFCSQGDPSRGLCCDLHSPKDGIKRERELWVLSRTGLGEA